MPVKPKNSMAGIGRFCILAGLVAFSAFPAGQVVAEPVVRCLTEPVDDVEMSSIVMGAVSRIHHGEGSFVEEGTVVLELESRSEELDVERRQVLVENLKANLERSEKLLKNTTSISREEVDQTRSEYRIAQIELELARDALTKKRVRAPFSGVVTRIPISVGEYCEPPQVLLRMVDTRRFYCVANINPAYAEGLSLGDPVAYSSKADPDGKQLRGEIVFISPVIDPASGLLRIKALFPNKEGLVRPGEGGQLDLSPDS